MDRIANKTARNRIDHVLYNLNHTVRLPWTYPQYFSCGRLQELVQVRTLCQCEGTDINNIYINIVLSYIRYVMDKLGLTPSRAKSKYSNKFEYDLYLTVVKNSNYSKSLKSCFSTNYFQSAQQINIKQNESTRIFQCLLTT